MYIRTPHALVWVESSLEQAKPASKNQVIAPVFSKERWAKNPLNTSQGRCVAVRERAGRLELGCMVDNRLVWLSEPQQVLSYRRLQAWLRDSF